MSKPLLTPAVSSSASTQASSSSSASSLPTKSLNLGKKLSLSVRDGALTIVDHNVDRSLTRSCCAGVLGNGTSAVTIPLRNLLWVDVGEFGVTIQFAKVSGSGVKPSSLTYPYDPIIRAEVESWTAMLLRAAYGESQLRKRFKVLINPFGGKGTAARIFERSCKPLLRAANCALDIRITEYSGHATEIAQSLNIEAFDAVLCCSGDGIPHEVYNGLGKREDARTALKAIAVCQLPGGSGNAMCWNLTGTENASLATLEVIKSIRRPLDLISITQGNTRFLSFLSQSLGIIAECDLGTEDLRWMGDARFTYGLVSRIWKQTVYPCELAVKVAIDDKDMIRDHYRQGGDKGTLSRQDFKGLPELRFGTIKDELPESWELVPHPYMGNFYAGNMAWMSSGVNFFPASLPNDGMFDLVCVDGTIKRTDAVKMIMAVDSGSHFDMSHVVYRKILGYRIIPQKREGVAEEYISIDGERIPFEPFQAEVHSGLGMVLAKGHLYEAPGV